jgi:hypothetical protein
MNDENEMKFEYEATKMLLKYFHLNTDDRKVLNGKVRFSMITKIIIENLNRDGWFPKNWRPDLSFNGGLLEKLPGIKIKLYHKEEISIANFRVIEIIEYSKPDKAILKFLQVTFGTQIDDILINYTA